MGRVCRIVIGVAIALSQVSFAYGQASTTMGGRFATTKDPSSPVGTTRDTAVPRPITVTVADGTGRPCESRTSPRIVAVVACPYANDT